MCRAQTLVECLMWNHLVKPLALIALIAMPACASSPRAIAAAAITPPVPVPRVKPVVVSVESKQKAFEAWKTDFTQRAIAKGYPADLVRSVIAPTKINELALERDKTQPEFTNPIWKYVDNAASPTRLAEGKAALSQNASMFRAVEDRYRVSSHILTAIWGLETSYGKIMGRHDVPSALATFAFEGRRMAFGEEQLFAVLDILRSGKVTRDQLVGSWASAMGNTQFIPTTFRDYAVDFDGDGRKDLWKSKADAIGSAAHYLSRMGYWAGGAMNMETKLIVPAGANGPAIMTFKNFDVIKRYNNSTSYALGISMLAEALAGRPTLQTPWPKSDKQVAFKDLKRMQKKLTALGYDTKGADGIIGPNTRKAIQAWQVKNALPADGYIEQGMFRKIMASR